MSVCEFLTPNSDIGRSDTDISRHGKPLEVIKEWIMFWVIINWTDDDVVVWLFLFVVWAEKFPASLSTAVKSIFSLTYIIKFPFPRSSWMFLHIHWTRLEWFSRRSETNVVSKMCFNHNNNCESRLQYLLQYLVQTVIQNRKMSWRYRVRNFDDVIQKWFKIG